MAKLSPLEETLLNGDSSASKNSDPIKTRENENLTRNSNAGFFSILSFSWISPLIKVGNERTLNHEDIPLLGSGDSANGIFQTFRSKLESECGSVRNVTTLKLAKVLVLSTWQWIFLSGLFAFLYTCASYVGPFLIDILVQYLNGEYMFRNEGYILAAAFVAAKLLESLSDRHCMFRFQQVGIQIQAKLVAMIYAKGLTLSCQSKEVHSTGESLKDMPCLTVLSLTYAYEGQTLHFQRGGFPKLRKLILSNLCNLNSIRIDDTALQSLEYFELTCLDELKTVPEGIQYLQKLKFLDVPSMPFEFVEEIHRIGKDKHWTINYGCM